MLRVLWWIRIYEWILRYKNCYFIIHSPPIIRSSLAQPLNTLSKSALCTTLFVYLLPPGVKNLKLFGSVTLLAATYKLPCANGGLTKYTPTLFLYVWPWALCTVIAKAGTTGNCKRFHLNGKQPSFGSIGIRQIKTSLPVSVFVNSIEWHSIPKNFFTINFVPMHNFFEGSQFLISIQGWPIFNFSSCSGKLPIYILLRCSIGGAYESVSDSEWSRSAE